MSTKLRQQKVLNKKVTAYIYLLVLLGLVVVSINFVFLQRNPLFISPIGKSNINKSSVEKFLKESNILSSQILVLGDSSYLISILNNGQVRLSSQKDIASQVSSLQRILKQLTIEGKPFKSIDFRFSEPIILF